MGGFGSFEVLNVISPNYGYGFWGPSWISAVTELTYVFFDENGTDMSCKFL